MQLIFMPVKEAKNWQLSFIQKKKKEFTKHLQGTSVLYSFNYYSKLLRYYYSHFRD